MNDIFNRPSGYISMIIHEGGQYNIESNKIENGIIICKKNIKNTITYSASQFMAERMAPNPATCSGISDTTLYPKLEYNNLGINYLAIGTGENDWDKLNATAPTYTLDSSFEENQTTLRNEVYRKEITSWAFIDSNDNLLENISSNRLRLSTTFNENEPSGQTQLVEMGLFGGKDAKPYKDSAGSYGKNTGYMFNYKIFPVWVKQTGHKMTIIWTLTF